MVQLATKPMPKTALKHFISANQLTRQQLELLFLCTDEIRQNPARFSDILRGKVVATLFFEPSTRTRFSFESAALRLGAHLISTENAAEFSSAIKGETLADTIRVAQCNADVVIMRHPNDNACDEAVTVATVPIINAGSGKKEHPTQALLDVYTVRQFKGRLNNLSVAIIGDLKYGRTIHSFLKLLSLYDGLTVYGLSDPALALPQNYIDQLAQKGIAYRAVASFDDMPRDIDLLYQTRVQTERIEGGKDKIFTTFDITSKVMERFSDGTLIMHPLPRVGEISPECDDDPRAVYFEQVKNGLYTRMALLLQTFKD